MIFNDPDGVRDELDRDLERCITNVEFWKLVIFSYEVPA